MSAASIDSDLIPAAPPSALWSRGLAAVLAAQFLSAMADNALLFGALALLRNDHYPSWTAPLLQEFWQGIRVRIYGRWRGPVGRGRLCWPCQGDGARADVGDRHPGDAGAGVGPGQ